MTAGEIIDAIWNLPWYKVLWVAVVDDVIIMLKLWPLWLGLGIICFLLAWWANK